MSLINVSGRSLRPVERDSTKSSVGVLWRELQSQVRLLSFDAQRILLILLINYFAKYFFFYARESDNSDM